MATIQLNHKGKDYCLEYTRKTVRQLEGSGITPSRILEAPMTVLPELFAGAFLAHHRVTDREVIDEIFAKVGNKNDLIGKLAKMYNEPLDALLSDPEEGNEIAWTVVD